MSRLRKAFRTNTGTVIQTTNATPDVAAELPAIVPEKEVELIVPESHLPIADQAFFGLENFGNTCYCNSVLQTLYHCAPFRQLIESYPNPTPPTIPNGPTPAEIAQTFKEIVANGGKLPGTETPGLGVDGSESNGITDDADKLPNKSRWSLAPQAKRQQSGNSIPSTKGPITRSQTIGSNNGGQSTPASPGAETALTPNANPPPRQLSHSIDNPLPPSTSNIPPPSLLSAIQSLFQYIEASPPHPPPPPKPPQQPQPGANTSGGTTLFNPHNPDRPFVRGGGAHGAGTMGKGVVKPEELVRTVKRENELFRGNMHQDAHEFLGWLLNKIAEDVEELEKSMGKAEREERQERLGALKRYGLGDSTEGKTFVHKLFEGLLTNETRCLTCETTSSRDESFLDLSIDIEQNSSVTSCLRQFSASEMLCQKNKFFCDTCCGLQEAEKRMKIKRLPNILALHLKRFKYQEQVGRYVKLAYRVVFPMQLRLFNTSDDVQNPDRLYELYAIVVHIGMGPNQGHYVAVVKHEGRWLLYDDENVEPVDEADIPRYFGDYPAGAGYVLFYQAVDLDPVSLGLAKAPPVLVSEPEDISPISWTPNHTQPIMEDPVEMVEPLVSPTFSTNIPMLDEEPFGAAAAAMTPKERVAAALADYQSSMAAKQVGKAAPLQSQSIPPITTSIRPETRQSPDSRPQRTPSHSPNGDREASHSSSLAYDQSSGDLGKSEKSGSRWLSKFGSSKDKDVKTRRTSTFGSTSPVLPPVMSGSISSTTSNGRTRAESRPDRPGTASSIGSGFDVSPQPGITSPSGATQGSLSRYATPSAASANAMSSSFMSTTTTSSDGVPPPAASKTYPFPASSPPPQRPGSGAAPASSGFASLGRGSLKRENTTKDSTNKDRSASGSSLTRRLSMNVPTLTRSSSAAFKSMLGGKKKDKDSSGAVKESEGY